MNTVEVRGVTKSFAGTRVVDGLSFTVEAGEVFGLVGPNGAGKTTTIRMLMDIIKPDAGQITVLGQALVGGIKDCLAYLPEERGLYRKLSVTETLAYFGALKGLEAGLCQERATRLLERVGMLGHKRKKIEELSRGMGQMIQFVATIIHDPEFIILDEPFAGLDPVNLKLLKELILELKGRGKTILLSTHMMNEVEELCDRILMIHKGRAVLYGSLAEIKARYRHNSVFLEGEGDWEGVEGVVRKRDHGSFVELFLDGHTSPQRVLEALLNRGVKVYRFEVSTPSLSEIFIQVVEAGQ